MQMFDIVTKCDVTKGGTPDEAFQVQCFLLERGASVGVEIFYMPRN